MVQDLDKNNMSWSPQQLRAESFHCEYSLQLPMSHVNEEPLCPWSILGLT